MKPGTEETALSLGVQVYDKPYCSGLAAVRLPLYRAWHTKKSLETAGLPVSKKLLAQEASLQAAVSEHFNTCKLCQDGFYALD